MISHDNPKIMWDIWYSYTLAAITQLEQNTKLMISFWHRTMQRAIVIECRKSSVVNDSFGKITYSRNKNYKTCVDEWQESTNSPNNIKLKWESVWRSLTPNSLLFSFVFFSFVICNEKQTKCRNNNSNNNTKTELRTCINTYYLKKCNFQSLISRAAFDSRWRHCTSSNLFQSKICAKFLVRKQIERKMLVQ